MRILFLWLGLVLVTYGCSDFAGPPPVALGTANQINVICDDALWDGPVGDTIRSYFESPYPMMPRPEPYFQLRHFNGDQLLNNYLRRELRTYLIIGDLNRQESTTTKIIQKDIGENRMKARGKNGQALKSSIGRNKWAKPQLLIYIFDKGESSLSKTIAERFFSIAKQVNAHDEVIFKATAYQAQKNIPLSNDINARYDIQMDIPGDYTLATEENDNTWIRKITDKIDYNIIITKKPYQDQQAFSREGMKEMRNEVGKLVTSTNEGSYMVTNDVDLPLYLSQESIHGAYVMQMRGIWEMEEQFMGGPFFSYAFLSPDKKDIVFVDAFIYAPSVDKKIHMQYLDNIVSTLRFN